MSSPSNARLSVLDIASPVAPDMPFTLQNTKPVQHTKPDEDDTSSCSSWYIPGITEKARCLKDVRLRRKTRSARDLYLPTTRSNESSFSSRSLHSSSISHSFDTHSFDTGDDDVRNSMSVLSIDEMDEQSVQRQKIERTSTKQKMEKRTSAANRVLLQHQLGSIRGLLEDHASIKGIGTFKDLQHKEKQNAKRRDARKREPWVPTCTNLKGFRLTLKRINNHTNS